MSLTPEREEEKEDKMQTIIKCCCCSNVIDRCLEMDKFFCLHLTVVIIIIIFSPVILSNIFFEKSIFVSVCWIFNLGNHSSFTHFSLFLLFTFGLFVQAFLSFYYTITGVQLICAFFPLLLLFRQSIFSFLLFPF